MDQEMTGERQAETTGSERTAELLDGLAAVLETHLRNHRGLLKVMERKKEACVQVQIGALEAIVAEERQAIEAIAESERERAALTRELAGALSFPEGRPCRLLDLINLAGEDHRETLLDLRDELRGVAEAMDRLNRLNRTLVLHSLEHVHLFLVMLRGADPEAKTYNQDGGEGGKAAPILVDRRI
jgi:flagellar biosynthesis/type III secretory pathway chaperone